jgi:DNA-binding LacI/PurR family transcriptional regulator
MARLLDVARAAGVSRSTVSNVFSRPERVSAEIRARVEEAAHRVGYAGPDPAARLLRAGKVNTIGVVTGTLARLSDTFRHPYMRNFMAAVADVCEEHQVGIVIIPGFGDDETQTTRNAIVDGFIVHTEGELAGKIVEIARRRKLPFVLMDVDAAPDTNSVRPDDRGGAREAARHLLGLGHRRFAIVSVLRATVRDPIFRPPARDRHLLTGYHHDEERLAGYAEALREAGLSIDDMPILEVPAIGLELPAGIAMLFDRVRDMTAILTMSDSQAFAVLDEAKRRGVDVPRDLSVVGFDDVEEAARSDPPLTTILQPILEKGHTAARMLFEVGPPRHVVLPLKLVVRGSTAPPAR